jgi:uncharacterized cupredoxin-like copper-binding protein
MRAQEETGVKRLWTRVSLLLASVILVACAGGGGGGGAKPAGGPGGAGQNFEVRALDTMRFEPATLSIRTGSPVSITLNNVGVIVHDLTIDNMGGQSFQVLANGGQRANGQFTPSSAGAIEFYCSQPGHKEAGMAGTLTVQ